jgi:hypothetical protein
VRGKGRTAQPNQAGVPHRLQDVLRRQRLHVARRGPGVFLRGGGVGADDDGLGPRPACRGTQLDGFDHAGDRCMVRHRQPFVAARNGLPAHHLLAHPDDGLRRLADVLQQGHGDLRRIRHAPDRRARRVLVLRRVDAARKGLAAQEVQQLHGRFS